MGNSSFPKGLRQIIKLGLLPDEQRGIIHLSVRRVNRQTGLEEDADLGAMTMEDFAAQVKTMQKILDEANPGLTLIERFGLVRAQA